MLRISERILKKLCLFIDNIGNRLFVFLFFLFFSIFFFSKSLFSQNYTYQNYNIQQGLAGSVAYGMLQDKEGFMWIATETGLSRFDGTHFRTFTTVDGLPDNDIMSIFEDSKGRIWILSFKNKLCFYQNGIFHTDKNTTWLKIALPSPPLQIIEDKEGNLLLRTMQPRNSLIIIIDTNNKLEIYYQNYVIKEVTKIDTTNGIGNSFYNATIDTEKGFIINISHKYFHFYKGKILAKKLKIPTNEPNCANISPLYFAYQERIKNTLDNKSWLHILTLANPSIHKKILIPSDVINIQFLNNLIFINTNNGSYQYDFNKNEIIHHFLPSKSILNVYQDKENNLWFSTRGNGIFRLQSSQITSFDKDFFDTKDVQIFHLQRNRNKLWIGGSNGKIFSVDYSKKCNLDAYKLPSAIQLHVSPVPYLYFLSEKKMIAFSNMKIHEIHTNLNIYIDKDANTKFEQHRLASVKDISIINKDSVLIATANGIHSYRFSTNQVRLFVVSERTTCVFYRNDSLFYGTMQGLKLHLSNKKNIVLEDKNKLLTEKFMDIAQDKNQNLWLSGYNNGVICIKNTKEKNEIMHHITEKQGLTSNIARCLFVQGDTIWVGTNKGLNKITFQKDNLSQKPIIQTIRAEDGLVSDYINTILVQNDTVYVGTPEGVSFFHKDKFFKTSPCVLKILSLKISNNENILVEKYSQEKSTNKKIAQKYKLSYKENNIVIDFVGLSYRSGGQIKYKFRLNTGNETFDNASGNWQETKNTSLSFSALAPDDYHLEIIAINKFGIESEKIILNFSIKPAFWQTWWFFVVLFLLLIALVTWVIFSRVQVVRKREQAQIRLKQQMLQNEEEMLQTEQQLLEAEQKNLHAKEAMLQTEQQLLRTQINPHFLFNSLATVQNFFLNNDTKNSVLYLGKFAKLMRQILENSRENLISLHSEIEMLENYLDLQKIRFSGNFDYTIVLADNLDKYYTQIPPMLAQPFVENALEHGFSHKNEQGLLEISFKIEQENGEEMLVLEILDNGVGLELSKELRSEAKKEYKSLAITITQERLELLSKKFSKKCYLTIKNRENTLQEVIGTHVKIFLPLIDE